MPSPLRLFLHAHFQFYFWVLLAGSLQPLPVYGELPDPLVMTSGKPVEDAEQWHYQRRAELINLLAKEMYGQMPPKPSGMTWEVVEEDRQALGGKATRKQVVISLLGKENGPKLEVLLYLPNKSPRPAPVILALNFWGNHAIHADPAIRLSQQWMESGKNSYVDLSGVLEHRATEACRGINASQWPLEEILARGYGLATVYRGDLAPDPLHESNRDPRVLGLYPELQKSDDNFSTIGAWAWGLSRVMDYLVTDSEVSASRVAVFGWSRLGKAALWAGATDGRFALVMSHQSGSGGAKLFRREKGESIERLSTVFPHWFSRRFGHYSGKEQDLPWDQHQVLSLIAPRPLSIASAQDDHGADPEGEFASARAASAVYQFLGTPGLPAGEWPQTLQGQVSYFMRPGGHSVTLQDWEQHLSVADRFLKKPTPTLPQPPATTLLDTLHLGTEESERTHQLLAQNSEVVPKAATVLGQGARRILPLTPAQSRGGSLIFQMKCHPDRQNYATLKLWGGDQGREAGRLYLFLDGKQVGYQHLGDVTPWDIGTDAAACPGRFFYTTLPLPLRATQGKTQVEIEIRATGWLYAYGTTYDKWQYPLKQPTRPIYAVYTHQEGYFTPPADEPQGQAPAQPPLRNSPSEEVLTEIRAQLHQRLEAALKKRDPQSQLEAKLLARAYRLPGNPVSNHPGLAPVLQRSFDAVGRLHRQQPDEVKKEWYGYGPMGDAIRLLPDLVTQHISLDELVEDGTGGQLKRRDLWADALAASRDWKRQHRQHYTNQTMIADMNIYLANRGLRVIAPERAWPEDQARRYLHEAAGIIPWMGSDLPKGGSDTKRHGTAYHQITRKGLSREFGYVGYYGEMMDWMTQLWDATDFQDEALRAQVLKVAHARAYFRYPSLDQDGYRTMRLQSIIGWRDFDFPGRILYGQENGREASALQIAALTKDPAMVGYAQQMLEDGQFFITYDHYGSTRTWPNVRTTLLDSLQEWETVRTLPPSAERLPMSVGMPDTVFTDEENGVLALKHGEHLLYISLYWRSRFGINSLARVHEITPQLERVATVPMDTEYSPRGHYYVRADRVDWDFGRERTPRSVAQQYLQGEQLPVAQEPAGISYDHRFESLYSGRAQYYTLSYGPYLIGMNSTPDRSFDLQTPSGLKQAKDLVSGKMLDTTQAVRVPPLSTIILWLGEPSRP